MSRKMLERLEEICPEIPNKYQPRIKEDNLFEDDCYIILNHEKYPKISADDDWIIVHRHKGIWGIFGHPQTRISYGSNWPQELVALLNSK